jgi:hypothetical protein
MRMTPSNCHLEEVVKRCCRTKYVWMLRIQDSVNPPVDFSNLIPTKHIGVRHGFTNVLAKYSVIPAEILIPVSKGLILKPAHCTNQFTLHRVGLTLRRYQVFPKTLKLSSPIIIRHLPTPWVLLQVIARYQASGGLLHGLAVGCFTKLRNDRQISTKIFILTWGCLLQGDPGWPGFPALMVSCSGACF